MPTKNELIWVLIGYGYEREHFAYLDQLFDRLIRLVRDKYAQDFKTIDVDGNAHNYTLEQTIHILEELRTLTDDDSHYPGFTLCSRGCTSESISRVIYDYREKLKQK